MTSQHKVTLLVFRFETEMMRDWPLLVVAESVHIFYLLNSVLSLAVFRGDRPTRLPRACFNITVLKFGSHEYIFD